MPAGVLSFLAFFVGYWLIRGVGIAWEMHNPLVTGLASLVPVALVFGIGWLVYRLIRRVRMPAWTRELCSTYGLSSDDVEELNTLFR